MITIENIQNAYATMQTDNDFLALVQALESIGVKTFSFYVHNGSEIFTDIENNQVHLPEKYKSMEISNTVNQDEFEQSLKSHQKRETDFSTFLNDCAKSGVSFWIVDLLTKSCTYFDKNKQLIYQETLTFL